MDEFLELFSNISYPAKDDPSHFFFCSNDKDISETSYAFRMMNNNFRMPSAKELSLQLTQLAVAEKSHGNKNVVKQSNFYVPCMTKRVLPKQSTLDSFEMKECYFLTCGWGKEQLNSKQQEVLASYVDKIKYERSEYQTFVSTQWRRQNYQRYLKMPEAAKQFIEQYWQIKINSALALYPNFYNKLTTIPLVYGDTENPIKMEFQRGLHNSGSLMQLRIPYLKKKHMLEEGEKDVLSSTSNRNQHNYQQPVSLDELAENLAIQNEANFVLSSSSFKKLVDNFYPNFTNAWELPIVVKEVKIGKTVKRVIFIDKALPATNLSTADKSKWFTKKAVISFLTPPKKSMQTRRCKADPNQTEIVFENSQKGRKSNVHSSELSTKSEDPIIENKSVPVEEASHETFEHLPNHTQTACSNEKICTLEEGSSNLVCNVNSNESKGNSLESVIDQPQSDSEENSSVLLSPNQNDEFKVGCKKTKKRRTSNCVGAGESDTSETTNAQDSSVSIMRVEEEPAQEKCDKVSLRKRLIKNLQEDGDANRGSKRLTRFNVPISPTTSQSQDFICETSSSVSDDKVQISLEKTSPDSKTTKKRVARKKANNLDTVMPISSRMTRRSRAVTGPVVNEITSTETSKKTKSTRKSKKVRNDSTSPDLSDSKTLRNRRSTARNETPAESSDSSLCVTPKSGRGNDSTYAEVENLQSSEDLTKNKLFAVSSLQTQNKKNSSLSSNDEPMELSENENPSKAETAVVLSPIEELRLYRQMRDQKIQSAAVSNYVDKIPQNLDPPLDKFCFETAKACIPKYSPARKEDCSFPLPASPKKKDVEVPGKKPNINLKLKEKWDSDADSDSDNLIIDFMDEGITNEDCGKIEKNAKCAPLIESRTAPSTVRKKLSHKNVSSEIDKKEPSLSQFNFYQEVGSKENSKSAPEHNQDITAINERESINKINLSSCNSSNLSKTLQDEPLAQFYFEKAEESLNENISAEKSETNGRTSPVHESETLQDPPLDKFSFETAKSNIVKNTPANNSEVKKTSEMSSPSRSLDSVSFGGRMNVSYNLWTLHKEDNSRVLLKSGTRSLILLVRTKNLGVIQENNFEYTVNPTTKVEYNPEFGASCLTLSESTQAWADLFIKPYTNSIRVRVAHSDYEVMMTEKMRLIDAITELQRLHQKTPQCCYNNLYSVLVKLADLDVGNYTLRHEPRDGAFAVLYKASNTSFGSYNLQRSYQKNQSASNEICSFIPIDTFIMTPANHYNKTVPATFTPKYVAYKKPHSNMKPPTVPVRRNMGMGSNKKKKKKNNKSKSKKPK